MQCRGVILFLSFSFSFSHIIGTHSYFPPLATLSLLHSCYRVTAFPATFYNAIVTVTATATATATAATTAATTAAAATVRAC